MRYDRMYSWFVRLYIVFKKKKIGLYEERIQN